MTDRIKVGDEVVEFDVNRRDGSGRPTVVEKVGRTLVYLKGHRVPYELDTGRIHDGFRHSYFLTRAQAEEKARREGALKTLRDRGITFNRVEDYTTEQIEALVKLVRTFGGNR